VNAPATAPQDANCTKPAIFAPDAPAGLQCAAISGISRSHEVTFTAARVSAGLGISKRVLLKVLGRTFTEEKPMHGNMVRFWSVADILRACPAYHAGLLSRSQHAGCRSIEEFLSAPDPQWKAAVWFHEAGEYYQVRAQKLQAALNTVLLRQHEMTRAELLALGLRDYRSAFGDTITAEHFWHLFDRTVRRAGTSPRWEDLNLYLDENAARKQPVPVPPDPIVECSSLAPVLRSINRLNPSPAEQSLLFLRAFEFFDQRVAAGGKPHAVKRTVLDFLHSQAANLAPNPNALRAKWDLKYKAWVAGGRNAKALDDGRTLRKGIEIGYAFDKADLELLAWHIAYNCAGKVSQGVRELSWMGDESPLSTAMRDYLCVTPSDKSGVPDRLREAVTPLVKMLTPRVLGGLHKENSLAYHKRDWGRVKVYECFCADDFTWPVYFWLKNADGSYGLTRGQCLLVIDARTLRVLEYSLQQDRNYNSRVIRSLMTRVGENWAWPDTWLFERGIWKESKLIHGSTALPWGEVEYGLERLGTRFIHAIHARSKPVERVGGAIQAHMENLPGYCGREERHDCPEHTRKAKLMVERGGNPEGVFFSFAQWEAEFARVCERYNAEVQNGDIIRDLSPDQALERLRDPNDAPRKFGPDTRWLLANHKSDKKVTTNGITLRFGRKTYVYRSAVTSELQHQIVRCYWNPDTPEMLTITDLADQNPRCVPLSRDVHPLQIDDRYLEEAEKAEAHNEFPKVLYRTLKAKFNHATRPNLLDGDTAERGREINRVQTDFAAEQKHVSSARRYARKIGIRISDEAAARPESTDELRRLNTFLSEEDEAPTPTTPGKTYVLDTSPAVANLPQLRTQLFAVWNQVQTLKPGLNRHAITCKALGYNKSVPDMTREEIARCMEVFSSILRDAKKKGGQ
jgi:hypothetical protein